MQRFQQPNFNLGVGGGMHSITPFRSLMKTPNPISRILGSSVDDNKLSEIKGDYIMNSVNNN